MDSVAWNIAEFLLPLTLLAFLAIRLARKFDTPSLRLGEPWVCLS
jgi:hypothetical protein